MTASPPATRVPFSVLTQVFDESTHNDVVTAAKVCQHWRATATEHSSFYRTVRFAPHSSSDLTSADVLCKSWTALCNTLAQTAEPLSLRIQLPLSDMVFGYNPFVAMEFERFARALGPLIGRSKAFNVELGSVVLLNQLLDNLAASGTSKGIASRRAPLLRSAFFALQPPERFSNLPVSWPRDLFQSDVPRLITLALFGLDMPTTMFRGQVEAFKGVQKLLLGDMRVDLVELLGNGAKGRFMRLQEVRVQHCELHGLDPDEDDDSPRVPVLPTLCKLRIDKPSASLEDERADERDEDDSDDDEDTGQDDDETHPLIGALAQLDLSIIRDIEVTMRFTPHASTARAAIKSLHGVLASLLAGAPGTLHLSATSDPNTGTAQATGVLSTLSIKTKDTESERSWTRTIDGIEKSDWLNKSASIINLLDADGREVVSRVRQLDVSADWLHHVLRCSPFREDDGYSWPRLDRLNVEVRSDGRIWKDDVEAVLTPADEQTPPPLIIHAPVLRVVRLFTRSLDIPVRIPTAEVRRLVGVLKLPSIGGFAKLSLELDGVVVADDGDEDEDWRERFHSVLNSRIG